jgi:hypothetical protein
MRVVSPLAPRAKKDPAGACAPAGARLLGGFAAALLAFALAQLPGPARAERPSAQQREAAAEAYDRGTSAWLSEDYAEAASFFETAHRLAPTEAALVQAVRAHARAGNDLRAATLALRLRARYPDDARAARVSARILSKRADDFVRVDVRCRGCTVDLDGTLLAHPSFFVEPGVTHRVTASFATGEVTRTVQGKEGERVELALEAPEPAEQPPSTGQPAPAAPPSASPADPAQDQDPHGGGSAELPRDRGPMQAVPRWVTISAMGATAALGGVTLWSGLDTLSGVDDYEAMPTRERLERGQRKERRTNALIGVTAALGAATAAAAAFTDWDGPDDDEPVRTSLEMGPEGGALRLEGRF